MSSLDKIRFNKLLDIECGGKDITKWYWFSYFYNFQFYSPQVDNWEEIKQSIGESNFQKLQGLLIQLFYIFREPTKQVMLENIKKEIQRK